MPPTIAIGDLLVLLRIAGLDSREAAGVPLKAVALNATAVPGRAPYAIFPWLAISSCARSTHVIWISSFCHGARADGHTPGHQVHRQLRRGVRLHRCRDHPNPGSLAPCERDRGEVGTDRPGRVPRLDARFSAVVISKPSFATTSGITTSIGLTAAFDSKCPHRSAQ